MSSVGEGFQVQYPSITIHAVSKSGLTPIVYCQIERPAPEGQEDTDGDDDIQTIELNIIPSDASTGELKHWIHSMAPPFVSPIHSKFLVDTIFEALSHCASLHPNPNMEDEFEDDDVCVNTEGFETFTGEDGEELSEVGRVRSSTNDHRYAPY